MTKLIRIAVSGLLLCWIGWKTDWARVANAFATLRVECWLAAVGLLALTQIVSAIRWQIFSRELKFQHPLHHLACFYFIGMYFNLLLPTSVGGDVVRALYINRGSGRRLAALASVFLDRLNGVLVLVGLACAAVLFSATPLPAWVLYSVWGVAACGTAGVLGLVLVARWGKLPAQRMQQMQSMVRLLKAPHLFAMATALSVFVQVANVVIVWLIGVGLDLPVPMLYYGVMVPMVSLVTLLPISVNGMGLREESTALFLLPFGVDATTAYTLAFLWFAVHLAVSVLGGLVYLFAHFPKPESSGASEESSHGPVDRHPDQGREGQLTRAA